MKKLALIMALSVYSSMSASQTNDEYINSFSNPTDADVKECYDLSLHTVINDMPFKCKMIYTAFKLKKSAEQQQNKAHVSTEGLRKNNLGRPVDFTKSDVTCERDGLGNMYRCWNPS
jgi:hypothetical protein